MAPPHFWLSLFRGSSAPPCAINPSPRHHRVSDQRGQRDRAPHRDLRPCAHDEGGEDREGRRRLGVVKGRGLLLVGRTGAPRQEGHQDLKAVPGVHEAADDLAALLHKGPDLRVRADDLRAPGSRLVSRGGRDRRRPVYSRRIVPRASLAPLELVPRRLFPSPCPSRSLPLPPRPAFLPFFLHSGSVLPPLPPLPPSSSTLLGTTGFTL